MLRRVCTVGSHWRAASFLGTCGLPRNCVLLHTVPSILRLHACQQALKLRGSRDRKIDQRDRRELPTVGTVGAPAQVKHASKGGGSTNRYGLSKALAWVSVLHAERVTANALVRLLLHHGKFDASLPSRRCWIGALACQRARVDRSSVMVERARS